MDVTVKKCRIGSPKFAHYNEPLPAKRHDSINFVPNEGLFMPPKNKKMEEKNGNNGIRRCSGLRTLLQHPMYLHVRWNYTVQYELYPSDK